MFMQKCLIKIGDVEICMSELHGIFRVNDPKNTNDYSKEVLEYWQDDEEHQILTQFLKDNLDEVLEICKKHLKTKFS